MIKQKGKTDSVEKAKSEGKNDQKELEIAVRKIDLNASNPFQLHQLQHTSDHFITCQIEEESEVYRFIYHIENQRNFLTITGKDFELKYKALIQLIHIISLETEYTFPMQPENFYLDQQDVVRVLQRDIQMDERNEAKWLEAFRALSGSMLQSKYSYDDLLQGGTDLLKNNERTKSLLEWTSLADAKKDLHQKLSTYKEMRKNTFQSVKKINFLGIKIALAIFVIATAVTGGLLAYQTYWIMEPQEQALVAERAFIAKDYVTVIDSLKVIPVEEMNKTEKYILAVSYIRSQSVDTFSNETKEIILSKLIPDGIESVMEYWIYLGRMDTEKAEDIALMLSDNQLLLYAYLQELDYISKDKSLSGTEKSSAISDLEKKIKELADKLNIDYSAEKIAETTANAVGTTDESTSSSTEDSTSMSTSESSTEK